MGDGGWGIGAVQKNRGDILITVLVFAAITITVTIGLVNWGASVLASIRNVKAKEQAFQIAEAGIDYYRWHLAQYPTDYVDGTTTPQPYVHNFYKMNGDILGNYSLTIPLPPVGSTLVKIISKGTASSTPPVSRTIQAIMAIPSFAKFAVVANDNMRFGEGTEIFGPVHSNKGIRFDGVAHNLISSALPSYNDTDPDDCNSGLSYGVHTCVTNPNPPPNDPDNSPPVAVPSRPDIFIAGRQFPVPSADFAGMTSGLTQLQTLARNGGIEWTASNANSNTNTKGYHMVFNADNTYRLYKVTALDTVSHNCEKLSNASSYSQWGAWSIDSQSAVNNTSGNNIYTIPSNGIIFFDDNVWVDGTIDGSRVTIVAGLISESNPDNYVNITVNSGLKYTHYDGTDVIALIAQNNINVGLYSEDILEIDGALVAENGRVGRYYYDDSCGSNYGRSSLTLNGMIASNVRYGFAYIGSTYNCGGSIDKTGGGYCNRNINYDGNLLYSPPPSFPLATSQYQLISWKEI